MRIALVSRELAPFRSGGIGRFTAAAARVLSEGAEVTVFTTSGYGDEYERQEAARRAADEPPSLPESVRLVFVSEPTEDEVEGWYHVMQLYSARVWEALREEYADRPPDLIEFPDYLGEGFVTLQAAATLDPFLAGTRVCVRLHTTAEIVEVLNGHARLDLPSRIVHELERQTLAGADRILWAGGDVLGTYERFYGSGRLAPAAQIRHPFDGPRAAPGTGLSAAPEDRLRLLFVGRAERRKGVVGLLHTLLGMERDDWSLSVVGGDTDTGPLGTSVTGTLELMAEGEERVRLLGPVEPVMLPELVAGHDVVVVPSRWECWPYVALEAFAANRPVLAASVGGLVEMVVPGRSGWLTGGAGANRLEARLEEVLDGGREGVEALVAAGGPLTRLGELCDPAAVVDGYARLVAEPVRRPVRRPRRANQPPPLVSVVVPYFGLPEFVGEAVRSALAQSWERLELVLVLDGSFETADWVGGELSARCPVTVLTQVNQGLGAARNFGIAQSHGRYVFPLDADNVAEASFVERCVAVLEARPEVAYVTSWSRYVDERGEPRTEGDVGYEPLGNGAGGVLAEENVAGDAAAVLRRELFDSGFRYSEELASYEDWAFYRRLAGAGHLGAVIPERLVRYRVRGDSMQARTAQPNRARLMGEIEAHIRENEVRWTA